MNNSAVYLFFAIILVLAFSGVPMTTSGSY